MEPFNKPDAFEGKELDAIRSKHLAEYYEMLPDTYRYARTLYVKASCLSCHASAENAPADVKARYGTERGFGFREGEVAGIISVRLPTRSFWSVATGVIGPVQIALLLSAFLVAILFIQFAVVRPVRRQSPAPRPMTAAQQSVVRGPCGRKSGNEIHQLILATERLRASLMLAIQRNRRPPPT